MTSKSFIGTFVFLLYGSVSIQAASTWSGNPQEYRPVTTDRAGASLEEIRSRALSGQLTTDDILRAAAEIKAVEDNVPGSPAANVSAPVASRTPVPESGPYTRTGTDLQVPINDVGNPLSAAQRNQLMQVLDRIPMPQLSVVQKIQVAPPASDPDRGRLLVSTEGNAITLHGTVDLEEAITGGVAAIVYEHLRGTPLEKEWLTHGDFSDFVATYQSWVKNTPAAFDAAKAAPKAAEEFSKLFFVASLFSDDALNRITLYDPAPKVLPWQIQQGHYGFGPYTFDIYQNQIVRLSRDGVLLSASSADIPSMWTRQGLGN